MKLLICTQVVDKNHPILGFFHRWLEEFAKHCEQVHVICLFEGEHQLPRNVTVHSLGKDTQSTFAFVYTWRLLKQAWRLRREYENVFVHMIPGVCSRGPPVWLLTKKPVYLWYTHGTVSLWLQLANLLVNKIFTADAIGMNLKSKKVVVTGHGIDIPEEPAKSIERDLDLLTVGRITPSKNLEELIAVLALVRKEVPNVTLTIIGSTGVASDETYLSKLHQDISKRGLTEAVHFVGPVLHEEIYSWLRRAKVFVHAATNGSLDKVLLEALAVGTPVVSNAEGAKTIPLGEWFVSNQDGFTKQILGILEKYDVSEKIRVMKNEVYQSHCLNGLIKRLYDSLL